MEERVVNQEWQRELAFPSQLSFFEKKDNPLPLSGMKNHVPLFPGSPEAVESFIVGENSSRRKDSLPFAIQLEGLEEAEEGLFLAQKSWEATKISLARRILKNLDQHYKKIFRDQILGLEEDSGEKKAFFNSNILYLIAATDGNEDTLGHSQLVARYTVHFARTLGIEDINFLINLERGALLHDIGKIGVPESILRKKGPLSEREREVVEDHSVLGYEMIEEFDFLKRAAQVVLFHHERYDGRGYQFGLAGEEIPLEARIFALADTLDAITSERPYNSLRSFDEALFEIEKSRGAQFDPFLADVFLSIPVEKWHQIKTESNRPLPLSIVN